MYRTEEEQWAANIAEKLNGFLSANNPEISVVAGHHLHYAYQIVEYSSEGEPIPEKGEKYQTDLLIQNRQENGSWIPLVVIECKLKINTHESLVYSAKAATHKHVHPDLRYGILVANQKSLPGRLVKHGSNFDFIMSWRGKEASREEWEAFCNLLKEEVNISKTMHGFRKGKVKKYNLFRRKVIFEEEQTPNPDRESQVSDENTLSTTT